ncbi:tumor necrosis factor receptor superfamily member 5 isoform X1 [Symphalangus syndactylus]|uniref:tumor necrosis factor receptor superfamily member 5 isoform X1 n=1 Tax=Symphalangus syndactylus TaxID=9590 RepID=UPI003003ACB6
MVRLPLQCVLWGCLLTAVHPEPPTACREKQYLINSQCCSLCQPGQKLVSDCTEFAETECLPCGESEFLDTWNRETRCHQHKYCDPNLGLQVQQKGTSETDTICTCEEGRHCTSEACESCVLHRSCSPGFGVKQIATGVSDTICEPCPVGFFSSVSSAFEKCHPWTSCETKDLVVQQAGTNKTDVVCGESWTMGPGESLGRSPGSAESPGGDPHYLRVPVCHPLGAGLYQWPRSQPLRPPTPSRNPRRSIFLTIFLAPTLPLQCRRLYMDANRSPRRMAKRVASQCRRDSEAARTQECGHVGKQALGQRGWCCCCCGVRVRGWH